MCLSYPDNVRRRWESFSDSDVLCFCEMGHMPRGNYLFGAELFCECGRPIVRSIKKIDLRKVLSSLGGGPIWNYYGGFQRVKTGRGGWVCLYHIRINYFFEDFHFPGVR